MHNCWANSVKMRCSLRYIAFASSGVLSGVIAYKLNPIRGHEVAYAAGAPPAEVLRSGLASETKEWNKNWDFRNPGETTGRRNTTTGKHRVPSLAERFGDSDQTTASVSEPTAVRHLVFIRHGQYAKADEDKDKVLTFLGRQQAEATGKRLLAINEKHKVDKIVISTMTRAKETGEIIRNSFPNIPYEYCDFIREGAPCRPEPPSSSWRPENHEIFQDSARIEAAFRKYFHRADPEQKKDSIEVYVCHANVIRYFVCRALQFPPEGWLRMSIGNCGITWFTINPSGRVSLRSMGDTGHLPPNLITTS